MLEGRAKRAFVFGTKPSDMKVVYAEELKEKHSDG